MTAQAERSSIYGVTVKGAIQRITDPIKACEMSVRRFEALTGQYELSNGKTVTMTYAGRKVFGGGG